MGSPIWRSGTAFRRSLARIHWLLLKATKGMCTVLNLFENNRSYILGDPELEIIGDRDKLAQWRHKHMGPAYYRLGRKIIYRGADLNAWAEACRVDPDKEERGKWAFEFCILNAKTANDPKMIKRWVRWMFSWGQGCCSANLNCAQFATRKYNSRPALHQRVVQMITMIISHLVWH